MKIVPVELLMNYVVQGVEGGEVEDELIFSLEKFRLCIP
jgi:hypothetical protein